jgi:hypothetical protein
LGAVSAEDNSTDDLYQSEDCDVLENTVTGNTFNDIQTAVSSCHDGDTLELDGEYTGSDSPISISKSITIEGNGATLNAKKKTSILKVSSNKLTLKNIKFTNSNGVVITSKNCNLMIINCTFINNGGKLVYDKTENLYSANCDYAGIYAKGGEVTLVNSTFSANSIANDGLSVRVENGQLTAINTTFSNHVLDYDKMSSSSDIISLYNSKSSFDNCTFKDNTVPAIFTNTYACIANSRFENNYKGMIYFGNTEGEITSDDELKVLNSKFTGTSHNCFMTMWDVALNIEGCIFSDNTASIINSDSLVKIENSQFNHNSAKDGAIFEELGNATVINSTFTGNVAERGSIVYSYNYLGCGEKILASITFINSTVTDSMASVEGGAIFAAACNITLINTNISTQKDSKGSQIYLKVCNFESVNSTHQQVKREIYHFLVTYSNIKKSTFDSRKRFEVNVVEKRDGQYFHVSYTKVVFKVYTGKIYKVYYYDGENEKYSDAFFRIKSALSVGKHKVVVLPDSPFFTFPEKTFTLTIEKAKTTVKAKKVTAKYKKSKYFKVTVKNKASGKVVSKIKIKVKVYTGKKYRAYTLKTDEKGVAKLNTKKLKRGTHKVVITSKNKNYSISKKSKIKIK